MCYPIVHKIRSFLSQNNLFNITAIPNCSKKPIPSAVLMLIYPQEKTLHTLFILRPRRIIHGGELALPGGKINHNETIVESALRESYEEISLQSDNVTILGSLPSYYIPISNHTIFPIVGYSSSLPILKANPKEVEKIIYTPIDILSPNQLQYKARHHLSRSIIYPFIDINTDIILWGATLSIVLSLTKIYHKIKSYH